LVALQLMKVPCQTLFLHDQNSHKQPLFVRKLHIAIRPTTKKKRHKKLFWDSNRIEIFKNQTMNNIKRRRALNINKIVPLDQITVQLISIKI